MADYAVAEEATSYQPSRPGERLRAAREAQGLTLADIATRTRIPTRHLEAIEQGNYTSLPSITYATGFTKAYARAVGIDEVDVAREARAEIDRSWDREPTRPSYDPADPARVPSRGLALGGLLVALLVMIGAGIWFGTDWFRGGTAPAAVEAPAANTALAVPPPGGTVREVAQPVGGGQVTLTATDAVWVRVYDDKDTTLYMREMAKGDRFDVPPSASNPMINVGRPDKLTITVNGSQAPALGDGRVAIKDVPIGAEALLARARGGEGAVPTPRPTTPPTPAP